jgi:acyl carrier protein
MSSESLTDFHDTFPASFGQQRLLFLHELDPTGCAHSGGRYFKITGTLDPQRLQAAVDAVVARHEALRTVFSRQGQSLVQQIYANVEIPVHWLSGFGSEEEAVRRATQIAQQPFDVATGPLMTVTVLVLAPAEYVLVLAVHLLAADGWSLEVLLRELGQLYNAAKPGSPVIPASAGLPDLAVQYADWSDWQRSRLTEDRRADLTAWWWSELEGAPLVLDLAAGQEDTAEDGARPDRANQVDAATGRSRRVLDPRICESAIALAKDHQHTVSTAMTAVCAAALAARSGQDRLLLGLAVANRDQPQIQGVLGFFVNSVPLHIDLSADPSFAGLLRRVADTVAGAYAHKDLPFEALVAALNPVRHPSRAPVLQVNFAHHYPGSLGTPAFDGCQVRDLALGVLTGKFELTIRTEQLADGALAVSAEYDGTTLSASDAEQILDLCQGILEQAIERPEAPLSSLLPRSALLGCRSGQHGFARTSAPDDRPQPGTDAVARIFAEILGTDRVGEYEDFFSLGGDSAQLFEAAARIRRELRVELALRDLYSAPNPAAVAAMIAAPAAPTGP